ncbi:MAG: site-specific integrase [Candidatus Binatus sp.]|uniref:tyrosine-type recombinase/integrase n=1 Tax=Candidatus Binatus sp. TaxID=2811406 RepID=UPI003C756876
MSVYKRGETYWFKFLFQGQLIRESAKTNSKTVAREAERARRREIELAVNRIPKRERMPLFSVAAKEWLASRVGLAANTIEAYEHFVETLTEQFGKRLVCDIDDQDISTLQRKRLAEEKSARTVNFEINVLRQILKAHGLWGAISDKVKSLRERRDVGRAISCGDEKKLIDAAAKSRSPALLPLLIVSLDSGLRASEIRSLRRRDLMLEWRSGLIEKGALMVPKSKTEAGTGRSVPLTSRVCAILTLWLSRFLEAEADSYVFPRFSVGLEGNARRPKLYAADLAHPIGEWKKAWKVACKAAKVQYRWHDCRHTFITRLAENPNVSEETIRSLAGHVSRKMLERYSHIRISAKQAAIATLDQAVSAVGAEEHQTSRAQNWAQSAAVGKRDLPN